MIYKPDTFFNEKRQPSITRTLLESKFKILIYKYPSPKCYQNKTTSDEHSLVRWPLNLTYRTPNLKIACAISLVLLEFDTIWIETEYER